MLRAKIDMHRVILVATALNAKARQCSWLDHSLFPDDLLPLFKCNHLCGFKIDFLATIGWFTIQSGTEAHEFNGFYTFRCT